jgi:predicted SAM-dependent methyltransferase
MATVMQNTGLKSLVQRRSTRLYLRSLQRAGADLWHDLVDWGMHGRDLKNYCAGKSSLKLHLGCGPNAVSGWVNIDIRSGENIFYHNMLNPLPVESGSAQRIHAEHFLEHLEFDDALRFLQDCRRVLAPGGTMRVIVPDAEKYMRAYASDDGAFFDKLRDLGGTAEPLPTNCAICNQMFRMGGDHRFAWDFETLNFLARRAGFGDASRSSHNDPAVPHCIDAQDWWRPVESLYAELS